MPRRTRTRFARRSRPPGHSFWLRPPAFSVSLQEAANGVFSSILLNEADFSDPSLALNDTMKGAPILERIVCNIGYDQIISEQYFSPAGFNQVTMLVEAMLFTQDDTFATTVTDTTTFDAILENNRILGYEVMKWDMAAGTDYVTNTLTAGQSQVRCRAEIAPKSRVKLREKSVGMAIRTNFDTANAAVLSIFPWVQATMLVRIP